MKRGIEMKMWRAGRQGVTLENVKLIKGHGRKKDLQWIINSTQTVNQRFRDNDHAWCDTLEQARIESIKLREAAENDSNVQSVG